MGWVEHVAGSLAREMRDLGFWRVTVLVLTFPGLVVYGLASTAVEVYFPKLHAWPRLRRERRYAAKMDRDFRDKFGATEAVVRSSSKINNGSDTGYPLQPDLETRIQTALESRRDDEMPKDLFFGRLPPEVRRQILVAAFGEHIVHVDLQYRYPYQERKTPDGFLQHTKHITSNGRDAKSRGDGREGWRWFSCVCHNYPVDGRGADQRAQPPVWLSHGRRTLPSRMSRVNCLEGISQCERWQGSWPEKCHVGAMGWLLTSKQAYMEGVEVLYRTNTFNIASPILLRSFHTIIPRQMRTKLCSLTLVWDLSKVKLSESFNLTDNDVDAKSRPSRTTPRRRHKYEPPIFPSLRHLRVALDPFARSEKTLMEQGLPKPLHREDGLTSKRLHDTFYPRVEELLDRLAPATTEITFTVSDWELYERIDVDLVERQGEEETRLRRSELGGLKCWKERRDDPTRGYWIHIGTDYMGLDQAATPYDWERHKMYGLGDDKYECTWRGLWREGFVLETL